mmetsp:Transcript_2812/g.6725  ORF Transcript_2812/g.6725 Transcript_2812/m.6725 type:complete len:95 (+) Transcript_2812:3274-3558(+)
MVSGTRSQYYAIIVVFILSNMTSPKIFYIRLRLLLTCLQGMSNAQFARAIRASSCTRASSEARQLLNARSPSFILISVRHSESNALKLNAKDTD